MAKRKRDVPVLFWVSAEELELIHQKMQQYGTENLSAYLRKMALDGYVVKLELPELKELVSLMRRSSNNLNQLTRKVHETGRVYNADLEDISQRQDGSLLHRAPRHQPCQNGESSRPHPSLQREAEPSLYIFRAAPIRCLLPLFLS